MDETKNDQQVVEDAVKELREADEDKLKATIEKWFESTRTEGMKVGAYFISAGVYAAVQKNLQKAGKNSLNDYRRCIKDIMKLIEVQLKTQQNDSEETTDDGAAETEE